MHHPRKIIRQVIVELLKAGEIDAAPDSILDTHDKTLFPDDLPLISVYTQSERLDEAKAQDFGLRRRIMHVGVECYHTGDTGAHHRVIYPDGTAIDYDDEKKAYRLSVAQGGSFELVIGGGVSIHAKAGKLVINAPEGIELQSDGNVLVKSPSLIHNQKNVGDTHRHTGVMSGPSTTGGPV